MTDPGRLLLDTHVWVWLVRGNNARLGQTSVAQLERSARKARLFVSVISVWEVAQLESKGRLGLGLPVRSWIDTALSQPEFELLGISADVAVESCALPGVFHPDPADRFLVASARTQSLTIVTSDSRIIEYGTQGHVKVMAA